VSGSGTCNGKAYVDLEGSGRDVTTITGTISGLNSLVSMQSPSEVRELSIVHTGGGATTTSALALNAAPSAGVISARRLTLSTGAATADATGVYLPFSGGGNVELEDLDITVTSNGTASYGIRHGDIASVVNTRRVRVTITGAATNVFGISSGAVAAYEQAVINVSTTLAGTGVANGFYSTRPFTFDRGSVTATAAFTANGFNVQSTAGQINDTTISVTSGLVAYGGTFSGNGPGSTLGLRNLSLTANSSGTTGNGINGLYFTNLAAVTLDGSSVTAQTNNGSFNLSGIESQGVSSFLMRGNLLQVLGVAGVPTLVGLSSFSNSGGAAYVTRFDQGRIVVVGSTFPSNVYAQQGGGSTQTISVGASQISGGNTALGGGAVIRCINSWNANDGVLSNTCL
jgi:hypothetical protein